MLSSKISGHWIVKTGFVFYLCLAGYFSARAVPFYATGVWKGRKFKMFKVSWKVSLMKETSQQSSNSEQFNELKILQSFIQIEWLQILYDVTQRK